MKTKTDRLKRSFIIGLSAIVMISAVPSSRLSEQSWFISFFGRSERDSNSSITVIDDSSEDVEFGFGLFDLFRYLFS